MELFITENFLDFDPVVFFETTASNLDCAAATAQFEVAIDKIASDTGKPYKLVNWCLNVKTNNYEILNNDETKKYWTLRNKTTEMLQNELNKSEDNLFVKQAVGICGASVRRKVGLVQKMKRKMDGAKSEDDSLLFNNISVATKLKNSAESHFSIYSDLSKKEQHVVGMSLNSIIDLSDETLDSQKRHFTNEQWDMIKDKYLIKTKIDGRKYKDKLKNINKHMKKLDLDRAYILARKLETSNLNSEDEALYNIYAHIINVYRKRSKALKNSSKKNTELDPLLKIWGEVLETLYSEDKNVICKGGESKGHHNPYKIDCCLVYLNNEEQIDISDIEAARYMYNQKINEDHLKLCTESKDILDYIVSNSSNFNNKNVQIYMVQICQNNCEVKRLYLCDQGLYCLSTFFDLTLPLSPDKFAKTSHEWFGALFKMKNDCKKVTKYIDGESRKKYKDHFSRSSKNNEKTNYKDWIRDTFYPPRQDSDPLMLPKNLYGSDNEPRSKRQC